jgi:tetratricopeptide (TPR) repeat protein
VGRGAGAYATVRDRYRTGTLVVRHAHGYVPQTLADLGWAGLGLSLLALFAFLAAAVRVLGLHPGAFRLPWDAERVGMATLAVTVLVFGVHSALDWSWFVPGSTAPALLCAGWLASRPPLRRRLAPAEPDAPAPSRNPVLGAVVAVGLLVLASAAAWAAVQPVRSVNAEDAAFERMDEGALPQAASIARIAHDRDPLAVEPLFDIATIEQARGNRDAARRALEEAIRLEPATAEVWRRLGQLRLTANQDPKGALRAFQAAFYLDPKSPRSVADIVTTSRLDG